MVFQFRGVFCKVGHPPTSQILKILKNKTKSLFPGEEKTKTKTQCLARCLLFNLSS